MKRFTITFQHILLFQVLVLVGLMIVGWWELAVIEGFAFWACWYLR